MASMGNILGNTPTTATILARQVAKWMQDGFTPDDDAFDVTDSETGVTTHVDLADQPQGAAAA